MCVCCDCTDINENVNKERGEKDDIRSAQPVNAHTLRNNTCTSRDVRGVLGGKGRGGAPGRVIR